MKWIKMVLGPQLFPTPRRELRCSLAQRLQDKSHGWPQRLRAEHHSRSLSASAAVGGSRGEGAGLILSKDHAWSPGRRGVMHSSRDSVCMLSAKGNGLTGQERPGGCLVCTGVGLKTSGAPLPGGQVLAFGEIPGMTGARGCQQGQRHLHPSADVPCSLAQRAKGG